jgi:hypothetical protein
VSRAVSQNLELKTQLVELQDRLVQVINESAAREDERLTALAAVERLQRGELDAGRGGGGGGEQPGAGVEKLSMVGGTSISVASERAAAGEHEQVWPSRRAV